MMTAVSFSGSPSFTYARSSTAQRKMSNSRRQTVIYLLWEVSSWLYRQTIVQTFFETIQLPNNKLLVLETSFPQPTANHSQYPQTHISWTFQTRATRREATRHNKNMLPDSKQELADYRRREVTRLNMVVLIFVVCRSSLVARAIKHQSIRA